MERRASLQTTREISSPPQPGLVTIVIATKDRPGELLLTLQEMRRQDYPSVEMLVVDDGSAQPVQDAVHGVWPGAVVVRHDTSAGQCQRRNEGFWASRGEFILQLDDDCSFVKPTDLTSAVATLQGHSEAGALAFYAINSQVLPASIDTSHLKSGCVASFLGAAVLFRAEALRQTRGYRTFFSNEWEEEELGLQLLNKKWRILFVPSIVAHHRLSVLNRNSARTWMRGLRNRIWAIAIHFPLRRMPLEFTWKLSVGVWDAIRLGRGRLFCNAVLEAVKHLPQILQIREPLSSDAVRRYDALRLNPVLSEADFEHPPALTFRTVQGFWHRWRNRPRNRNSWDRTPGDAGSAYTVAYAHEQRLDAAGPTTDAK